MPELSYILAELLNMCPKESCFLDCSKVSLVVLVFKNVGGMSIGKDCCPVSLLFVVSKVFEKLVNNRIADHQDIHKNIQLLLEFLKALLFLNLYFSYYTLMTFLMILSAILLSVLMILVSLTLSTIRQLICGNN